MTRKALGRGLNALLGEPEPEAPAKGVDEIPVSLVDPNSYQPRRTFPSEGLEELANSIRATGLLQPVLVRRKEGRYELVAGERRLRAARLAGLEEIPAVIRDVSDNEALEFALMENLQREDLNPLEVAQAYEMLHREFNLSHDDVAKKLGVSRSAVSNTLRLLRLSPAVQQLVTSGKLTEGHARALASLSTHDEQERAAEIIVGKGLNVRQAEQLIKGHGDRPVKARVSEGELKEIDPNVKAAIRSLETVLGTKVRINGSENRGTLEIKYFSAEDLIRIFDIILRI